MQPVPVRPTKAFPKLCAEATSLTTAPARLVALSQRDAPMGPLALRNPNLPTARLTEALRLGKPAAWDNPAAPFALWVLPAEQMRAGAVACGLELARLRKEGKAYPVSDAMRGLLRVPMADAWYESATTGTGCRVRFISPTVTMMADLSTYALWRGPLGPIHRKATLLFCLLVRSILSRRGVTRRPRVLDTVERLTWDGALSDRIGALIDSTKGLTVTDPVGALAMFAMVPATPDWDGGGVGSIWAQAPDGFEDVIRAALPEAPWLAELA